ncbi:MAG: T9SS type A sorting domain-containing protein, partial [Ekhidna sp.]
DTEFKLEAFVSEAGIEITIDRVLGLILEYFKDLEVYPNPVIETLKIRYRHLKSGSVNAQLVDLKGNVLWHDKMQQGFDGQKEIDVSGLSKGIYLLHIFDNEGRDETVVSYRIIINE